MRTISIVWPLALVVVFTLSGQTMSISVSVPLPFMDMCQLVAFAIASPMPFMSPPPDAAGFAGAGVGDDDVVVLELLQPTTINAITRKADIHNILVFMELSFCIA